VKEKKLPEANDDLAKTLGYEDLKDMRAKFEERLENNKKAQVDRKLRSDLIEELIKKNPFDVPSSLIQAQARVNLRDLIENLRQQGFNDQMIAQAVATEQESLQKRAESQVRAGLILEAVGKKEGVKVEPSDFEAEYKKIALSTQMKEADVSDYYEKNREQKSNLEFRIREEKAIALVLLKSKVKG
jgi:trigger factor